MTLSLLSNTLEWSWMVWRCAGACLTHLGNVDPRKDARGELTGKVDEIYSSPLICRIFCSLDGTMWVW